MQHEFLISKHNQGNLFSICDTKIDLKAKQEKLNF